jgi:vacuolar-type H+-ATPase subunit E/Vma4
MKKAIKIISVVLIALILIIILIPFIFKGKIKEMVIREANKSLNATLVVGKVNVSLLKSFPSAYVELNDLVITGKGDFDGDTLLSIGSLGVSASIMDLIGGSPYEIKKVSTENADVRLRVLADGQANWDIVKPSGNTTQDETSSGTENFRLLLKSFVIKDSRLVYDDIPYATHVVLEGLNHSLSGDLGADFTTLKTQTSIKNLLVRYEGVSYLKEAVVDWKADLDADLVKNNYTFKENKLNINNFPIVFEGTVGVPDEGYDLQLSFATPENSFKSLLSLVPAVYSKEFSSVKADGTIGFNGFVKGKYNNDQYPAFLINLDVKDAWFQYPNLPAAVNDINITALIESPGGDLDNIIIDMKKITMNLAGNPVKARLLLKNPMTDPYLDVRIEANFNLSDIQKFYPLEAGEEMSGQLAADVTLKGNLSDLEKGNYNAFDASGRVNTSGINYSTSSLAREIHIEKAGMTITPAYLDLTEMKIRAGNSDFNLKGKLGNYLPYYLKDETLTGNFDLKSTRIDVNELLAVPESDEVTGISDSSSMSAFIVPESVDLTLAVSASSVEYLEYDISNLTGIVRIKDQKLYLDDISMYGMGGRLEMNGSYASTNPENPAIDINLGVKDISINETFKQFAIVKKFAPIAGKIIGDYSGHIKLSGILDNQMKPKLETMAGGGNLITSIIQVTNVNTLNQLASALKMDQLKELQIAGAKIKVEFLNGVMGVNPFDFKALGIDMNLGGQTSLDQKIGYDLKMKIPRSMMGGAANNVMDDLVAKAGQAGADVKLGEFINVDALIDGTLSDPKVRLNLAGTGNDIMQSVKDQVEEKVEELKDDAKEEAEKFIQEADRQAQAIIDEAQRQAAEVLKAAQNLADETIKQANANADNIVSEAKGEGYLTELAAKKSAEEIRKQGDKQAQNILNEAQKQSDSILEKARQEADKIKAEAQKKVNQ